MRGEWVKAGIEKVRTTKLNELPIPAKAGISLCAEAGRATPAPHRFVICANGAGIGRFPLSREWRGAGTGMFFCLPPLFCKKNKKPAAKCYYAKIFAGRKTKHERNIVGARFAEEF